MQLIKTKYQILVYQTLIRFLIKWSSLALHFKMNGILDI